jgi:tetratricopeptide (TPR) repeat protein
MALLRQERDRTTNGGERLSILLRLARLAAAGGDEAEARACLEEAAQLEPKRDRFLSEAHQVLLTMLRGEAARLGENGDQGLIDPGRVESAVRALVDLGEVEQAQAAIRSRADALPEAQTTRLHAWIALRHGDYPRAYDLLKSLGPSRLLAYGAARAGDYVLASQTLECLARTDTDPALQVALKRLYRDMVAAEMLGGSRRLQAETILTFNQREAA